MSLVIDYAWGKPNYSALKAAGVSGVVRYISHDAKKDLYATELRALRAHGLAVGLVFESTANRALGGYPAGRADARFSAVRLKTLGLPDSMPVYFAADFDANNAQKPKVVDYLKGASGVLGKDRVGIYGGYWVVKHMADHDVCDWFWQTYAWSGGLLYSLKTLGRKHRSAHIYQYKNGQRLGGVSCDFNRSLQSDWGQFPRPQPAPAPKPAPKPKPPPAPTISGHWQVTKTFYDSHAVTQNVGSLRLWALKQGNLQKKGIRDVRAHWVETGQ